MIYIGADHRGFELKEFLKERLKIHNYDFEDIGAHQFDPNDDYPQIALKVAQKVASLQQSASIPQQSASSPREVSISPHISSPHKSAHKGILICGSGIGVCFAANKVKGIRAGLGVNPEIIKAAREDDDINVLCLPSDFIESEEAWKIVEVFLNTEFIEKEKFIRRIKEVEEFEKHSN